MKYKLRKSINKNYDSLTQILTNRNIPYEEINHYLNTTDADIANPLALGDNLHKGAEMLCTSIAKNDKALIICDCDCDGFTSAALLINYLHKIFPSWIENNLKWYIHEGKQHGLADVMEYINQKDFNLIICPDSSSNDYNQHNELTDQGKKVLVLDHHEADALSLTACVINNQLSDYPNKDLSGVGITWQFCRYLDSLLNFNYADYYLDLVALGNTADVMSLTSIETKHLINKGFEPENIHNPYIYEMWQKNKFKLGDHITSIDAAFYIVPMINAVQRSGTLEEKELLFKSMLDYCAFDLIPSTKRGCKGQEERLVDQAVRTSTNVKNRQTKTQDAGMEYLENKIRDENLLQHKVLLLLLEPNQIDPNIAGLIANKLANKYQRPCCILIKGMQIDPAHTFINQDGEELYVTSASRIIYQGSARGYELTGLLDFKTVCEESGAEWAQGHANAFGMCISAQNIDDFIKQTDNKLANISTEPIYYVDFIYKNNDINPLDIYTMGNMKPLFGKDFEEPLIAIENLKVTKEMVQIFRKEKKDSDETSNTLKITLPNKITIMKFNADQEECALLENCTGYVSLNIVGTCNINEWMGIQSAQIFITDYEIVDSGKYLF